MFRAEDKDTICALSTPPGTGGIAVIRVSGSKSAELVRKLCRFLPEKIESHRVYYGFLKTIASDEAIDEVLATYFAEGRSFTGEETIEISCHGGPIIASSILKELILAGCRMAKRGEFTYRAFMSGRVDLVQAESILSLIESQSKPSAKVALRQLTGHLSQDFARIEDDLIWILAHLEASIDFSTEGIEVVDHGVLLDRVSALQTHVTKLLATYNRGKMLRDGIEVALVGKPNAGKSSLLNAFLKEDRAIVTPIAGTTRDTIEGRMSVAGLPVTLVDTAGLRETENEIELMGIERSRSAMKRADFVFHVVDASAEDLESEISEFAKTGEPNAYLLLNKIDLDFSGEKRSKIGGFLSKFGVFLDRVFWISATKNEGIDALEEKMASLVGTVDSDSSNVITQARHLELLQKIQSCLATAHRLISDGSSPEFIAFELQESVRAIHELLGKEFDEQVIDRIFKEFCLGK